MQLEPWAEEVRPLFRDLFADPEMMRHVGGPLRTTEADALFDRACAHWSAHGFGWRSAISRASRDWLGFFVLNFVGSQAEGIDEDEISVGWWIRPGNWGCGYATEGATMICREAFERIGARRVVAFNKPGNSRSLRVAGALGMELAGTTRWQDHAVSIYELQRSRWRSAQNRGSVALQAAG